MSSAPRTALAICASRVAALSSTDCTPTGAVGRNPVNTRLVTDMTEDSIRLRLGVLGCGAFSGRGAGTASGAWGATTTGVVTALSAREVLPRAHPRANSLAAACAAAASSKVASEDPSHNSPIRRREHCQVNSFIDAVHVATSQKLLHHWQSRGFDQQ